MSWMDTLRNWDVKPFHAVMLDNIAKMMDDHVKHRELNAKYRHEHELAQQEYEHLRKVQENEL